MSIELYSLVGVSELAVVKETLRQCRAQPPLHQQVCRLPAVIEYFKLISLSFNSTNENFSALTSILCCISSM